MIKIVDLHKSFNGKEVLRGISLEIRDGETLVILGMSGAGKSVLLKHIMRLFKPDKGEIYIDGREITGLPRKEIYKIRRSFGYVFQEPALFDSLTIYENVEMPLVEHGFSRGEIEEKVKWALEMVALEGVENKFPDELSGGMRKRVGIARAIVQMPRYLIYDEPTTGLDPVTADKINELMIFLNEKLKITSIVVTHDIRSALKIADRLVLMHEGRIMVDIPVDRAWEEKHPVLREFLKTVEK